ncbi:hypothetical protein [Aeromonas dhakensis]
MGFLSVFQIQIKKINKLLKLQTFGAGQFLSQTYAEKLTDIKKNMGHLPFGSTGDSKVMENEVIEKTGTLVKLVDWMVKNGQQGVGEYVEKLKTLNPGISNDDLAKK